MMKMVSYIAKALPGGVFSSCSVLASLGPSTILTQLTDKTMI